MITVPNMDAESIRGVDVDDSSRADTYVIADGGKLDRIEGMVGEIKSKLDRGFVVKP